ncbi:MAG TPA: hypothetical protein VE177_04055, partial [Candidatus Binatus sp.]|nr:hypothetical protein [Candidatus Binatus sp.]
GLSRDHIRELNPFVASAVQAGPIYVAPFILSYMLLAEALGALMLGLGGRLYRDVRAQCVPFAVVCGVGAFGPFSNLVLLLIGPVIGVACYIAGTILSAAVSLRIYSILKRGRGMA